MSTSTMSKEGERQAAMIDFYRAERRQGADMQTANERLHEFMKRYDNDNSDLNTFDRTLLAVSAEMEK